MQLPSITKAAILSLVIVAGFVLAWEYYWRSRGFPATHNDDKVLWASKRKLVNHEGNFTTFIGGSRIKFDLDIPTWEKVTGEEAIQLAIVGTPARPTLNDLANDPDFKGRVIIDVAEPQFFSFDSIRRERRAAEAISYYKGETPAQKASALINSHLESKFVFLEEGTFGLSSLLDGVPLPPRTGVFVFPLFPREFALTTADRQTFMSERFLSDTSLQNTQKRIWTMLMIGGMKRFPVMQGEELDLFFSKIKGSIDKIRSRGGEVVFVRPPSSGILLQAEKQYYPREAYWDRLLKETNTPGIHFEDYKPIANFVCPEMSHLSTQDAVTFTSNLVRILHEEKGWIFPNLKSNTSQTLIP